MLRRTADDDDPFERIVVANAEQLVIVTAVADPEAINTPVRVDKTPGRNEPCFCGSGKKYKLCHGR